MSGVYQESVDGREVSERFKNHEKRLKQLEKFDGAQQQSVVTQVVVAKDAAAEAQAEALQAKADALSAQADALEAAANALQAAIDAANAQEQIDLNQMVDPGNLFDYAPIIAKDASLFWTAKDMSGGGYEPAGVPNIVEWFPDGFTVESTSAGILAIGNRRSFNMGPEVRYNTRFSAALTPTTSPWPNTMFVRLGLWVGPYSWPAVDGPIGLDQPQIGSPTVTPNPGVDGEYYYPDATRAVSWLPGDPDRTTWRPAVTINFTAAGQRMTIRKIRMQVIAGTLDFTGGSTIPGASLVNGSVTANKLDPAISFTPADGSIGTAKLANGAVTNAKVNDVAASKITGQLVNSQIGGNQIATANLVDANVTLVKLAAEVRSLLVNAGSFRNIIDDPTTALETGAQLIPNNTWTQMPLPPTTGFTRKNTLNNGSAVTISGGYPIAPFAGRYLVSLLVRFAGNSGGTARGVAVQVGASGPRQMENSIRQAGSAMSGFPIPLSVVAEIECNAGDSIRPTVNQNVGSSLYVRLENVIISYLGPA